MKHNTPMSRTRRKQVEIGWALVKFFKDQQREFSRNELCKEMTMNPEMLDDWLDLYRAFNQGPPIREIKVNSKKIYEVLHSKDHSSQTVDLNELSPTEGRRRTKLATGLAFLSYLNSVEQAFFRTSMETVLGMAAVHSEEWIQLYQMFNQGPRLTTRKQGRFTYYTPKKPS